MWSDNNNRKFRKTPFALSLSKGGSPQQVIRGCCEIKAVRRGVVRSEVKEEEAAGRRGTRTEYNSPPDGLNFATVSKEIRNVLSQ
jgi:hypothetical protein